jgi:hypothetical protein
LIAFVSGNTILYYTQSFLHHLHLLFEIKKKYNKTNKTKNIISSYHFIGKNMWHTSNRKLSTASEQKESSTSAFGVPTTSTTKNTTSPTSNKNDDDWKSTLPLDWTRMGTTTPATKTTKRRKIDNSTGEQQEQDYTDGDDEKCCQDPANCLRRRYARQTSTTTNNTNNTLRTIHGQVVFCLHEYNPQWFQGYFVPKTGSIKKPWGLLAQQEEIDECLACSDGGYRRISLTIYRPKMNTGTNDSTVPSSTTRATSNDNTFTIQSIDWTGGE